MGKLTGGTLGASVGAAGGDRVAEAGGITTVGTAAGEVVVDGVPAGVGEGAARSFGGGVPGAGVETTRGRVTVDGETFSVCACAAETGKTQKIHRKTVLIFFMSATGRM